MITIYGFPNSRSLRVTWMMEELQQAYEYSLVDLSKAGARTPEYLAINPASKVPAMRDGDLVMTESAAIVTYLGDKFERRELVPAPCTALRGKFDQWCYFAVCELEQPLWTIGKHTFAIPEEYRVSAIFPTTHWEFQQALALLSKGLGTNDYILGESFSAADIMLAHTLIWGVAFKQKLEQSNLVEYLARIKQRPALQIAREREKAALGQ